MIGKLARVKAWNATYLVKISTISDTHIGGKFAVERSAYGGKRDKPAWHEYGMFPWTDITSLNTVKKIKSKWQPE